MAEWQDLALRMCMEKGHLSGVHSAIEVCCLNHAPEVIHCGDVQAVQGENSCTCSAFLGWTAAAYETQVCQCPI